MSFLRGSWRPGGSWRAALLRSPEDSRAAQGGRPVRIVYRAGGRTSADGLGRIRGAAVRGGRDSSDSVAPPTTVTSATRLRLPRPRCCELEARWYTATVAGPAGRRTHRWGYSSVGRAFGWQPKGHRFEPGYLHQQFPARLSRAAHHSAPNSAIPPLHPHPALFTARSGRATSEALLTASATSPPKALRRRPATTGVARFVRAFRRAGVYEGNPLAITFTTADAPATP